MTYGARVWGPTGLLELDENSFTVRVIYSGLVTRNANNFTDVAVLGCDPTTCSAVCIPVAPYPQDPSAQTLAAIQQEPQVLSGAVRVWFVNRNLVGQNPPPAPATSTQRLIVMRYR